MTSGYLFSSSKNTLCTLQSLIWLSTILNLLSVWPQKWIVRSGSISLPLIRATLFVHRFTRMVIKRDTSVSLPIKWKVILYLSGANNFPTLTSGNFVMYLQTNSFPSKLSWAILASKDTVDSEKQSNTVDKKILSQPGFKPRISRVMMGPLGTKAQKM